MKFLSPEANFFLDLAKTQAVLARRFDSTLSSLGLSWFTIMYHLSQARDEKMRRTDLSEKVGLTASGVTRILAPMVKIGLVRSEASDDDGRVSFISLAPGGKEKLAEAIEDLELFVEDHVPVGERRKLGEFSELLAKIAARSK